MLESKRLTIFQLNDSHSYLKPHPELFWSGDRAEYRTAGGYSRIATLMEIKRREDEVLAFDCGDTLYGTYPSVKSKGTVMLPILNFLGLDAMTAHWEFAHGPERFKYLAKELKYPVLAINCYENKTHDLIFPPFTILEKNDLLVGVIGIASNIVDKVMPAAFSEGLYFSLGKDELPEYVLQLLRERVDLIIVVSHLGFPQDVRLAEEVKGVDIWLSGHTHNRLFEPVYVNGSVIIQSGCHGSFLGRIDLEFDAGKVKRLSHRLLPVNEDTKPHSEADELICRAVEPHREFLERVAGEIKTALNRNTVLESTMDNFLLKSLIDLTGADLAFSNGWRYGAPVPIGPVTVNDLYNIIPMNPPVSLVKLTGREIWNMMEENLERTFSRDPYHQMGGYVKRCLGLNLYFKIENPPGTRIQEIFVKGRHLLPEMICSAAFVTDQGVPLKYGKERVTLEVKVVDAMERLLSQGPQRADLKGSVVAV